MSFSFQQKTETLNWDMVTHADIDQITQNTDITRLEHLLQNISNAKLENTDLRRIGDKNVIKLFKVGQLTLEYLLFAQQQSEHQLDFAEQQYKHQLASCKALEEKVKTRQKTIINLKGDLKVKRQTLKTYEQILKKPEGAPVEVSQCKKCFKYFASNSYLLNHYKRRHAEYYMSEIKAKEEELLQHELGEIENKAAAEAQKEEFFQRIKEDVVDKYNTNFVNLQDQLKTIKQQNQTFQVQQHQTSQQLSEQLTDTNYAVKEYQILIDEFKTEVKSNIENQQQEIKSSVKQTLNEFVDQEAARERELEEEKERKQAEEQERQEKEQQLRETITRQVEQDIQQTFDAKFEALQKRL